MFLSEWREFPSGPCLAKKKFMTARVSMLLKSRASLTCFRACILPGQDLSAARYLYCLLNICYMFRPSLRHHQLLISQNHLLIVRLYSGWVAENEMFTLTNQILSRIYGLKVLEDIKNPCLSHVDASWWRCNYCMRLWGIESCTSTKYTNEPSRAGLRICRMVPATSLYTFAQSGK